MSYREIVSEAKRLPLGQQLQLVEELLHAMRQTATPPAPSENAPSPSTNCAARSGLKARCPAMASWKPRTPSI